MADMGGPATPPRTGRFNDMPPNPITPEQIRRMEETRLKAKALRSQQLAKEPLPNKTPSGFITGQKRLHDEIRTSRASIQPTQRDARQPPRSGGPADGERPDTTIQAAKKFQNYVEYDFSKMVDTKGGFLTKDDDPFNRALHTSSNQEEKPGNMTLKDWERAQLIRKLRDQKTGTFEPNITSLGPGDQATNTMAKCRECASLEIDWKWHEAFDCQICAGCKVKFAEKYTLLTKTEAKEDYLLTDPELKDTSLLAHMTKPNPHKASWNDMMLYLRYQVEEYAFSDRKWGSAEALDQEFAKRQTETKRRRDLKFKTKLNDLKRRTMVDAYKRSKAGVSGGKFGDTIAGGKHEHEWGRSITNPATGVTVKSCVECQMEIEELEF